MPKDELCKKHKLKLTLCDECPTELMNEITEQKARADSAEFRIKQSIGKNKAALANEVVELARDYAKEKKRADELEERVKEWKETSKQYIKAVRDKGFNFVLNIQTGKWEINSPKCEFVPVSVWQERAEKAEAEVKRVHKGWGRTQDCLEKESLKLEEAEVKLEKVREHCKRRLDVVTNRYEKRALKEVREIIGGDGE